MPLLRLDVLFTHFSSELFDCPNLITPDGGVDGEGVGPGRFWLEDANGNAGDSFTVDRFESGEQYCESHFELPMVGEAPFKLVSEGVNSQVKEEGPAYAFSDAENEVTVHAFDDFGPPIFPSSSPGP